jgi:hypothetical protein
MQQGVRRVRLGPEGPGPELIEAVFQLNLRNPRCGCPRIAQQIGGSFAIEVDKDVVRRVLAAHFQPGGPDDRPSLPSFHFAFYEMQIY